MAQVIEAYCNPLFVYAAQIPGTWAVDRLARYLKVSRDALRDRLRELNIYLPPLHAVLSHGDMSTYDFSVQRPNVPTKAAIYGNLAMAAAEMLAPVRGYLARLQAKGTGPSPGECPFVCTPLCAAHRSLSARRL
jgi:hypothetical protein